MGDRKDLKGGLKDTGNQWNTTASTEGSKAQKRGGWRTALDHNTGYVRWAEPGLALKGTGNCRSLWAGMRSEWSLKEVPFAAVPGGMACFPEGTWALEF